jgi:MOSC domain-containing protein YiiM
MGKSAMAQASVFARILSVHVGKVAPLGPRDVPSGFVKHAVEGPVALGRTGLAGDEVADHSVHGGFDKAVYGYAAGHYPAWRAAFPQFASLLVPGGFGENLAFDGVMEADVCLGDELEIGDAVLCACQPRQPCSKLAMRFDNHMGRAMTQTGRAGWYFRVLQTGAMSAGDEVRLRARPNPDWSFARFLRLMKEKSFADEDLAELARLPGLAAQWQRDAHKTLERRRQARATSAQASLL